MDTDLIWLLPESVSKKKMAKSKMNDDDENYRHRKWIGKFVANIRYLFVLPLLLVITL